MLGVYRSFYIIFYLITFPFSCLVTSSKFPMKRFLQKIITMASLPIILACIMVPRHNLDLKWWVIALTIIGLIFVYNLSGELLDKIKDVLSCIFEPIAIAHEWFSHMIAVCEERETRPQINRVNFG